MLILSDLKITNSRYDTFIVISKLKSVGDRYPLPSLHTIQPLYGPIYQVPIMVIMSTRLHIVPIYPDLHYLWGIR